MPTRDFDYVVELALTQVGWGAEVLDVNVGVPGIDEVGAAAGSSQAGRLRSEDADLH